MRPSHLGAAINEIIAEVTGSNTAVWSSEPLTVEQLIMIRARIDVFLALRIEATGSWVREMWRLALR